MNFTRAFLLFLAFSFIPACGIIPDMRVGEKSVPPPVQKPPQQVEAERQAADVLAKGIEEPKSLIPVAKGLSNSLGKPLKPLIHSNPTREEIDLVSLSALQRLEEGMSRMQKQIDAQNKFLTKHAGKTIEGTGFDLMGPSMFLLIAGLIVLAVVCPPVMTLMFFAFRRLKAAAGIVVNEIEEASKSEETKNAVAAIKAKVADKMHKSKQPSTALKAVITDLKQ